jgi:hypothetical protein
VLGGLSTDQEGASFVPAEGDLSGAGFAARLVDAERAVAFFDSMFYDALVVTSLATLKAIQINTPGDPSQVTGSQIRDALATINDPTGEVVRTGRLDLAKAIRYIVAGKAINYEGASGPCDFDARRRVRQRMVRWIVQNQVFVDFERYNCVGSPSCPVLR